ncbi:MAG: NADP oxidoreductase [Acidobacteriota bacterium]|nr:NADP oxidoreductase [Acidobacteriota bacterium]
MAANDLTARYGLSDEWVERSAAEYESGDYEGSDAPVHTGSHLDAVGTKRETVTYDAADVQKVRRIAKERKVSRADIYRDALKQYLNAVS